MYAQQNPFSQEAGEKWFFDFAPRIQALLDARYKIKKPLQAKLEGVLLLPELDSNQHSQNQNLKSCL
jgi:hypothetical protein